MGRRPDLGRRQERQQAFLAAFAETGIASLAAQRSGIPGPQHYNWLKRDADYASRFAELRGKTREIADQNARPHGPAPGTRQGGRRPADRLHRQECFLEAISHGLSIMAAARETGMGAPTSHYQWIASDESYAERFRDLYERTTELRRTSISRTLREVAAVTWSKPAARDQFNAAQRRRRTAESGALNETHRQGPFLAIISQGIPLQAAVRDAGITKTIHRQWLASDPAYAAAFQQAYEQSAGLRTRVISEMHSRASEARWEDPDARAKMRERHREYWTPERREEFAQQMRERF